MDWKRVGYWLPRGVVLGFALSLVLPAPKFLRNMEGGTFLVWLFRVFWVLLLSVGCGLGAYFVGRVKNRKSPDEKSL
ncbi:MAG: hypothetical protein JW821_04690 [Deltaproteobacteria bacterium]|nr:hypothetical protein [Deltaproteobacteria bacterium]